MTTPKEEEVLQEIMGCIGGDNIHYHARKIQTIIDKIRQEAIAEVTKQIEEFAHKEMKDGNWAYEKLLILLRSLK